MTCSGTLVLHSKPQLPLAGSRGVFSGRSNGTLPAPPSRLQGRGLEPPLWRTRGEGELVFSRMEPPDKLSNHRWSP